jgi:hypothetical protein
MNDNAPDWAKKLSNIEVHDQLLKYVEEILPDWISHFISSYSHDYNFLSKNWEFICNDLKISPQKILLVKFLPSNKDSTDFLKINFVCDILTRKGYIIRRNTEFRAIRFAQAREYNFLLLP